MFMFWRLFKFHRRGGVSVRRSITRALATVRRDYLYTLRSPIL